MSAKDIIMSAGSSTGVVVAPAWINTLTCSSTVNGGSIKYDPNGNVYICGYVTDASVRKCFIAKYDASGTLLWQKYINAAVNGALYSLSLDSSGNIIFVGKLEANSGDLIDGIFLKYSPAGSLLAQQTFNSGFDILSSVVVSASDNIYISGYTQDDIFITKLNNLLVTQWSYKYYVNGLDDTNSQLVIDSSENIYLAFISTTTTFSASKNTLFDSINLVKLDSTGIILWSNNIAQSTTNLVLYSLACNDSNVYICYAPDAQATNSIATFTSAGALVRKNIVNTLTAGSIGSIAVSSSGNIYHLANLTATNSYAVITSFASDGSITWYNKIGVSGSNTLGISISLDNILGFYILAKISNVFVVCKFPTAGTKLASYTVGSRTFIYSASGIISFGTTDSVTITTGAVLKKAFPPVIQIGLQTLYNPKTAGSHRPYEGFRYTDASSNYYYVFASGVGYSVSFYKCSSTGTNNIYCNQPITSGFTTYLLATGDTTDHIYNLLSDSNSLIKLVKFLKTDLSVVWTKAFSVGSYQYVGVIKVSATGNIFLAIGPQLYKLNSSGTVLFSIKLTTAGTMISDIAVSSAEDVYVTTAYVGNTVQCVKFNSSLVVQWSCSYSYTSAISFVTSRIVISSDETKVIVATNMNFQASYSSSVVIGITSTGTEIFKKAIVVPNVHHKICRMVKSSSDVIYLTTVGKDTGDLTESIRVYSLDFSGNFTSIAKIRVGDTNSTDFFCWGMSFNSTTNVLTLNIEGNVGFDLPLYINDITPNSITNFYYTNSLYIDTSITLTFTTTTATTRTYSATIASGAVSGTFGTSTNIVTNTGTLTSLSWLPIDAPLTISSSSFTDNTASNTSVTTTIT